MSTGATDMAFLRAQGRAVLRHRPGRSTSKTARKASARTAIRSGSSRASCTASCASTGTSSRAWHGLDEHLTCSADLQVRPSGRPEGLHYFGEGLHYIGGGGDVCRGGLRADDNRRADAGAAIRAITFPAGPGRDALFKVCGNCHGPESVLGQLKTHDEWRKTLDEMASNGAELDDEWNQILAYLDKHYSLIFINKAAAKDLEAMLDVAPSTAEAIVRRRIDNGAYKSIDDLKQVPGVTASAIEARKDRLIF